MQFTTTTLLTLATALLPTSVLASGCYGGGATFSQYGDDTALADARSAACSDMAGSFTAGQTKTYCAVGNGYAIGFSASNVDDDVSATMSQEDCESALGIEMGACEHGSEQTHGGFAYKDDPQAGNTC